MIVSSRTSRFSALLALVLPAIGCGGGGEPTPPLENPVSRVTIVASATSLLVGQSLQLGVDARSVTGVPIGAPGPVTWRSSDTRVATVDDAGRLSAVAPGTTNVSATVAGVSGTTAFTVATGVVQEADVFTPGNVFSPFRVTLAVGGTVRFHITGVPHNVVFAAGQAGAPANINLVSNVTIARVFPVRGSFAYDCTVHPGMSGQVVVQ
jgi:plastocyanin